MIYRCPKCDTRFTPPLPDIAECPHCGIWFHKWRAEPLEPEPTPPETALPEKEPEKLSQIRLLGRAAILLGAAIWGIRLASMSYRDNELMGSFMHTILLPIHEAGHVFLMPFGEFLTVLGGSLFQIALPLGIGAAFLWRQRDAFGAAICLWWSGASLVDLSPYLWDSLNPQLILLGGHTGEDGPHDWIYLLDCFGALKHAHGWGAAVHHLGVILMAASIVWGAQWLWRHRSENTTPS